MSSLHSPTFRLTDLESFSSDVRAYIHQDLMETLCFPLADERKMLADCMQHAVLAGGKRVRPILVILAYMLLDTDYAKIIPLATAIEMLHTYSLIHDDLPAMDNDSMRRGKPTCHIVFGEATAILAGDTLNTYAFELLANELPKNFPPQRCLMALSAFAHACGIMGLAGGQTLDLASEGKPCDATQLQHIHALKTGTLMQACFTLPGILLDVPAGRMAQLKALGDAIGLLFQIVDDLLDETGDAHLMGKSIQKDRNVQKNTYVSHYGIAGTQQKITEQSHYTTQLLVPFQGRASELLQDMVTYLSERKT